jgi:hypothetical protein
MLIAVVFCLVNVALTKSDSITINISDVSNVLYAQTNIMICDWYCSTMNELVACIDAITFIFQARTTTINNEKKGNQN